MTAGRALGLVTILAAVTIWLASGYMANKPAPLLPDEPWPISETEVGRATARLVLGLRSLTAPSRHAAYKAPTRNPFTFGATSDSPVQPVGRPARSTSPETLARAGSDVPPDRPPMRLSGMAEDPGPQGPVRRAVIVAADQLFVVGTGDLVLARFRVGRIDAETVELEDLQGGPRTILALR